MGMGSLCNSLCKAWPRLIASRRAIAFSVCFISVVASLVWCAPRIGFEILRLRAKASFVIITDGGENAAFSLDERQTQELLRVIDRRTRSTLARRAGRYLDSVSVSCKNGRSKCLQRYFIRPSRDTESKDVLEELFRITKNGIQESLDSDDGTCVGISAIERVY